MFCTYNATIVHILSLECYIVNLHYYVIKCAQSMPNMYLYVVCSVEVQYIYISRRMLHYSA